MRTSTVINKAGGGDVLKHLEALDQKVEQMQQEQITQFNAVDRRFTMLEERVSHLLTSVKNLLVEMAGTRQALFAQHSRVKLSNCTDLLRCHLDHVTTEIAIADDKERVALKEEAKKLMQDIDKIEKEVEEQDHLVTSSLGLPAIYPPQSLLIRSKLHLLDLPPPRHLYQSLECQSLVCRIKKCL